jgi:hypothetical protein
MVSGSSSPLSSACAAALIFGLASCHSATATPPLAPAPGGADATASRRAQPSTRAGRLTPALVDPGPFPIPVGGSDGAQHLVYEIRVTNATSQDLVLAGLTVLARGAPVRTFSAAEVATMLQPMGGREASDTLGPGQAGVVFLALDFPSAAAVPDALEHRLTVKSAAVGDAPAEQLGPTVPVDRRGTILRLGPPLEPSVGYYAADGCCTAKRHIRAGIPIDGKLMYAQRFAIDWQQIDAKGRFLRGSPSDPRSYVIYGKQVLAAGDGTVVRVQDGLPEQVPGVIPRGITLETADGNAVVVDMGRSRFALYAHLQAGSIRVKEGDTVARGAVLGLVGNSGNTSAPHLHFHVMDSPSPLGSNGVPYTLEHFHVTAIGAGTAIFDQVENTENPYPTTPVVGDTKREGVLPLDLSVVTFTR